ncbi:MAG: 50S ribosomal protein L25 [Anaerolineae bacterium]|nr:50S ribosomal protein L25 [Anaerolineae bacterium]MDW8067624.1 50S ribosomal protein L25 [Anaerolineae bacterium]
MTQLELRAEVRTITGKAVRRLRREGWIPAVLYGPETSSRPLQILAREAEEIIYRAGTSHLITLFIGDERPAPQVLIRGVQRDPIRRNLLHVDFYRVQMDKPITMEIPIVLVGSSPVLERREGILLQGKQTLEIECLPRDLIEAVEVDLSVLTEVDQQITVADLTLPPTIRVLDAPDEMVVRISPPEIVAEEEEVAAPEPAAAEPELIRRRKVVEEEEEE